MDVTEAGITGIAMFGCSIELSWQTVAHLFLYSFMLEICSEMDVRRANDSQMFTERSQNEK
jgi:hypothetical protein